MSSVKKVTKSTVSKPLVPQHKCELCKIYFKKKSNLDLHYNSLRHKSKKYDNVVNKEAINKIHDLAKQLIELTGSLIIKEEVDFEATYYTLDDIRKLLSEERDEQRPGIKDKRELRSFDKRYEHLYDKIAILKKKEKETKEKKKYTMAEINNMKI